MSMGYNKKIRTQDQRPKIQKPGTRTQDSKTYNVESKTQGPKPKTPGPTTQDLGYGNSEMVTEHLTRPTLGHCRGGSLLNLMLINAFEP